jgi:signal recognition particle receptor subunit beta
LLPRAGGDIIDAKNPMVVYNAASKELTAKIVYYGPGYGGKTTNLQFLHRRLEPSSVGNLLTLAATADRTIFFDLLPVELGDLKGYRIRFQVATVPGQSPYNETRRVVLRGADGIVLVVDSRWSQLPKNLESLQNLRDNLREEGIDPAAIPFVVQFNKRDLPDVLAIDALQEALGLAAHPFIEATASEGKGVVETFKLISKLTFVDILRRLQKKGMPRPARPAPVDSENLSAWKTSLLHGKSPLNPEPAEAPPPFRTARAPEAIAFPDPEDLGATRAIPVLRPRAVPSPLSAVPEPDERGLPDAESQPIAVPPFAIGGAAREPAGVSTLSPSRADDETDVVFETFAPFPELPGTQEDTNPEFYAQAPAPREEASFAPADRVSTANFPALTEDAEVTAPETDITTPLSIGGLRPAEDRPTRPPEPEAPPPPEPMPAAPAPPSPVEERMIHLAIASTWGDRISAAEARIAGIEEKFGADSSIESRMTALEAMTEKLAGVEARLARAEGARGWERDVNSIRTETASARLALEERLSELRRGNDDVHQQLAEASGREMELVAQVSRESLGTAAAIEKLEFRIKDTEEKFSQLVVDQESRLSRLERLVDEQSARTNSDREAQRRAIVELSEEVRKLREETEERHRRASAELEGALRTAREERERERSTGQDLRGLLAESLAEIVSRLRRDDSAS